MGISDNSRGSGGFSGESRSSGGFSSGRGRGGGFSGGESNVNCGLGAVLKSLLKNDDSEVLVYGAELECSKGNSPCFLIVDSDDFSVNGLPEANVTHCVKDVNIFSFGECGINS